MRPCSTLFTFGLLSVAFADDGTSKAYISSRSHRVDVEAAAVLSADYVVVGGGVAGSIVAGRLARDPSHPSVILLEAGTSTLEEDIGYDKSKYFHVPGDWALSCNWNTDPDCPTDFHFSAVAQGNGYPARPLWTGKNYGGNGQQNGMQYQKGARADFERWAALGPEYSGWGPDEIWPYFQLHESTSDALESANPDAYGNVGPIRVNGPLFTDTPLDAWFRTAWQNSGMPPFPNDEPNGPGALLGGRLGGGNSRLNIDERGWRSDPFTGFITPLLENPEAGVDFKLIYQATATKIIFKTEAGKAPVATGVTYTDKNGVTQTVSINKELILTAGALNTPKLLLQSGVGPKDDLLQIPYVTMVLDLPAVGRDLTDHVGVRTGFSVNNPDHYTPSDHNPLYTDEYKQTLYDQTPPAGPLMRGGPGTIAFFRYPEHTGDMNTVGALADPVDGVIVDGPNLEITVWPTELWLAPCDAPPCIGFQLPLTLTQQKSRGSIKLNPAGIDAAPIIDYGYFTDESDLMLLYQGLLKIRDIAAQEPFKTEAKEAYPGALVVDYASFKDQMMNYDLFQNNNHHAASCSMGPDGVVNERLLVHGLANVRIADASVMPGNSVSMNPQATIMAIAEKAYAFIVEDNAVLTPGVTVTPTVTPKPVTPTITSTDAPTLSTPTSLRGSTTEPTNTETAGGTVAPTGGATEQIKFNSISGAQMNSSRSSSIYWIVAIINVSAAVIWATWVM